MISKNCSRQLIKSHLSSHSKLSGSFSSFTLCTIAYSDALLAMSQPAEARAVLMSAGLLHADVLTDPRLSQRLNLIEAQLRRMN